MNFFSLQARRTGSEPQGRRRRFFPMMLLACLPAAGAQGQNGPADAAKSLQALSDVVVYAAGDIADCRRVPPEKSGAAKTAALIESELAHKREAIVLSLGDHTYPDGHPDEFEGCYHPTWGRFKARTYPTPGNHEYRTPAAEGYFNYFGAAAGKNQGGYYRFQAGDWQIISLNSNLRGGDLSAQLEWLKSVLADRPAQCTLAYWHHPVFSSGDHGNEDIMLPAWRMLADANAELVLSAHDHHYERFAPMNADGKRDDARGTRQFVVGTGGARMTKLRFFKRHSEATGNTSHGVLKLILQPGRYAWEFLPTTPGAQADRGSGACR